ncbi:MAG: hypothetical protein ACKVT0_00500 [Planctomycetaceae bacterium]
MGKSNPVDKLYKMWYEDVPSRGAMLYAESTDGKTWTKPNLGLVELLGSKENNCVLYQAELSNVFLDPNAKDPQSRYSIFVWGGPFGENKVNGHILFTSGDGKHWNLVGPYRMPSYTDETTQSRNVCDTNFVMWDELGERYLGTYRTFPLHPGMIGWARDEEYNTFPREGGHRRAVGITMSKSLHEGWSPVQTMLRPDALDDEKVHALSKTDDPDYGELYIMPIFNYGNHYLGVVSLLFQVDASVETMGRKAGFSATDVQTGGGDLQLTFSDDGVHWNRQPDRQTLTAPSPSGLTPCYSVGNPPLVIGDELWMYYTEATSAHPAPGHQAMIRAAVWRKDGFASLDVEAQGSLETKSLQWEGAKLRVNLLTGEKGSIRIALLDEVGKVIPGYAATDCTPIVGDQVDAVAQWNGKSDLTSLKGQAIRLRFELTDSMLYSFHAAAE